MLRLFPDYDRRVFPAAVPDKDGGGCVDCAVALLCRALRGAAGSLAARGAPA